MLFIPQNSLDGDNPCPTPGMFPESHPRTRCGNLLTPDRVLLGESSIHEAKKKGTFTTKEGTYVMYHLVEDATHRALSPRITSHLSGRGTYEANNALLQAQAEHKAVTPLIRRSFPPVTPRRCKVTRENVQLNEERKFAWRGGELFHRKKRRKKKKG